MTKNPLGGGTSYMIFGALTVAVAGVMIAVPDTIPLLVPPILLGLLFTIIVVNRRAWRQSTSLHQHSQDVVRTVGEAAHLGAFGSGRPATSSPPQFRARPVNETSVYMDKPPRDDTSGSVIRIHLDSPVADVRPPATGKSTTRP